MLIQKVSVVINTRNRHISGLFFFSQRRGGQQISLEFLENFGTQRQTAKLQVFFFCANSICHTLHFLPQTRQSDILRLRMSEHMKITQNFFLFFQNALVPPIFHIKSLLTLQILHFQPLNPGFDYLLLSNAIIPFHVCHKSLHFIRVVSVSTQSWNS